MAPRQFTHQCAFLPGLGSQAAYPAPTRATLYCPLQQNGILELLRHKEGCQSIALTGSAFMTSSLPMYAILLQGAVQSGPGRRRIRRLRGQHQGESALVVIGRGAILPVTSYLPEFDCIGPASL